MNDLQHGFREKRSCETQLIMLIEDSARNARLGKQTDIILLDFSKVFDKVTKSIAANFYGNCINMAFANAS